MNDFQKSHSVICGGGHVYTSDTPCAVCGSQLFRHDTKSCHSCYQRAIQERRYRNQGRNYRRRASIDRMHEIRGLNNSLDSYSGL